MEKHHQCYRDSEVNKKDNYVTCQKIKVWQARMRVFINDRRFVNGWINNQIRTNIKKETSDICVCPCARKVNTMSQTLQQKYQKIYSHVRLVKNGTD